MLNRLKPQAEKIIAEEQAGFKAGRSTTELIFSPRILCDKKSPAPARPLPCLQRLKEGLRQGLACSFLDNREEVQHQHRPYPSHQNLYGKATSAVLFNSSIGDWFRTKVGVRQGCLLPPTLFNIFLERIMTHALEDHEGTVRIGGRPITNLRFANDISGLAGEEEKLEKNS